MFGDVQLVVLLNETRDLAGVGRPPRLRLYPGTNPEFDLQENLKQLPGFPQYIVINNLYVYIMYSVLF